MAVMRGVAAAAAGALVLALPGGIAVAEQTTTREQAHGMAPAPAEDDGRYRYADSLCVGDPAGDTFTLDEDGERVPAELAEADVRQMCMDYGEALALNLTTAAPTDPAQDPSWAQGESAAFWFLDTTAEQGYDLVAILETDEQGNLVAGVFTEDGEEPVCGARASFDGARLTVSGIPAACVDDADFIVVAAVFGYDREPLDPDEPIYFDVMEDGASVGRTGAPTRRPTDRLAGGDRFATAVAISNRRFPEASTRVYLARADTFADALAAGALGGSAAADGPILLVPTCGELPAVVAGEIARLDPETVIALGGPGAVCDEMLEQAAEAGDRERQTDRLAGTGENANRYGTAVAIAERAFPEGAVDVYLATGLQFPDALTAGSLTDGPILLAPSCGDLPPVVAEAIDRSGANRVVGLGGPAALCDDILEQARTAGGADRGVARLAGNNRFSTAAAVARFQFPEGAEEVYVARADDFPDALAAGALTDGPILLVPRCGSIPAAIADVIRDVDPELVIALGGESAVCQQMLRHAANA